MNKIGLAINRASQGTGSVLTCNPDEWTSHITSIGEYIKLFGPSLQQVQVVPFLTFIEEGCFLGVLRYIEGSDDDYFGGWIYVPRNITVSGAELKDLLEYVQDVLNEESISLKANEICTKFSATYTERYSSPYIASSGDRYGVRKPGVISSLTDILEHRYQESYRGFKAIFLTDPVYVANEYKSKFGNFTNRKLEKSFIVIPPSDVSSFGSGTKLLVFNGEKYVHFSTPVRTKEGTPLRMSLKRPPFDSYRFTYNPTKDNDVIDLQPLKFEWTIRVSRSKFIVLGDDHKPVVDAIIRIDDEVINGDLLIKESVAHNAEVIVSAVGYKESKLVLDLFNLDDTIEIELVRNNENYTREVILSSGKKGRVTIEAPGLDHKECPLSGYTVNDKGILTVDRLYRFKQRAIGFGAAFGACCVLGLGAWGISGLFSDDDPEEPIAKVEEKPKAEEKPAKQEEAPAQPVVTDTATKPAAPVVEEVKPVALSDEAKRIIAKDVWRKSELDDYEELNGLFDALNHYRFAELTGNGKWAAAIREAHPDFADFIANGFPERQYTNPSFLPDNGEMAITIPNFKSNVLKAAERKKNGGSKKSESKPKAKSEHKSSSDKSKAKTKSEHRSSSDKPKSKSEHKSSSDKSKSKSKSEHKSSSDKSKSKSEHKSSSDKSKSKSKSEHKSSSDKPKVKIKRAG